MDEECAACVHAIESMDEERALTRALNPIEQRTNTTSDGIHFIQG